jgi:mono/diheme cytochrome c family protein
LLALLRIFSPFEREQAMIKKSLLAGAILALPAVALAPRGADTVYVPTAHAQDTPAAKGLEPVELGNLAWAVAEQHCISCHGEGKAKHRASPIDKTTLPKLIEKGQIKPGKPEESAFYTYMIDHDDPMPPKNVTVRPSKADIALIKIWIEKGAPSWVVEEKKADGNNA